jgi:hypothetical protein
MFNEDGELRHDPADGGAGGQASGLAQRLRAGGGQIDAEPARTVARALSRCHAKSASGWRYTDFQAAATTSRHVLIAAVRSVWCVWAEVRWRWTLKVLKTAACVERNFCAEPALLKRCILRSRRRVG